MNTEQFREHGKSMVDFICEYRNGIGQRNVAPILDPGYLQNLIPGKYVNRIWTFLDMNQFFIFTFTIQIWIIK